MPAEPDHDKPGDGAPPDVRKITDARTLRALAHPVRIALLEALLQGGPQTATEAGEQIGETPTTCSFHLRQLARYGFVEEAGGGSGRARPWRLSTIGLSFTPDRGDLQAEMASEAVQRLMRERQLGRYEAWRTARRSFPEPWEQEATDSEYVAYLTVEELRAMNSELHAVLWRWSRHEGRLEHPERRPAGSLPVETLLFNYPVELPGAGLPAAAPAPDEGRP